MTNLRPTWAEVDLSAIRDNICSIRSRVGPSVRVMPAVKANAYGHGAIEVSRACLQAGASALCVATVEEGIQLREAGFGEPILVLGCSTPDAVDEIVRFDLAGAVCDLAYARALSAAAVEQNKVAEVHIKVDTGMGRIGVMPDDALRFTKIVRMLPGLRVEGVYTHFPSADEPDRSFTILQIAAFTKVLSEFKSHSINVPMAHAANSAAVMAFPESCFNAVRPGIMIYGGCPLSEMPNGLSIRQAMTLKTRIVFLKDANIGATIGYGRTHSIKRPAKIATLPIGYADGYQRALSNCGEAAVRGVRVPVVGRVCMDQITIDVTEADGVQLGDEVILMGGGYDYLRADNIAARAGTISDETFCVISGRVPRVYINE